ncbi:hypothetical protein QFC22_002762 [Naganishia vaughanmartiniae]|uniref:Uncharacterized protein n=1 Tax=Naganishia vaughanmartiniae TaxID=1424756 RepID=A0ACC2XB31_9TREE|nr:hypothetical protein QFC22_002762 [Naganishia vaughanmartiniae]
MSATQPPSSVDPWKSHKAKANSLSVLWNPIKRVPPGAGLGLGVGVHSEIRYISSPIHSLDGDSSQQFVFPVQSEESSGSTLDMDTASTNKPSAQATSSSPIRTAQHYSSLGVSPSASEKKRPYSHSLRKIFLHRKSNSMHGAASARYNHVDDYGNGTPAPTMSPAISAPWGLTVASFRPAPVAHHHQASTLASDGRIEVAPDLRQLRLEDTMLVSRESDRNGLLAQQRARDMPVPSFLSSPPRQQQQGQAFPLARSTSLGNPLTTATMDQNNVLAPTITTTSFTAAGRTPERPKRYEASTMCEKFVLPRPRLVAHSITPPTSPPTHLSPATTAARTLALRNHEPSNTTTTITTHNYAEQPEVARIGRRSALFVLEDQQRAASPALSVLSGTRVLQEGKKRDWEREEWAAARVKPGMKPGGPAGGGGGGGLRMRLSSATREADGKYAQARFAPMPVAYERVGGGEDVQQQLLLPSSSSLVMEGRKKSRSGSLGDLLAGPFMRRDRANVEDGTASDYSASRLVQPVRSIPSSQQQQDGQRYRRASEPSLLATPPATTTAAFTFLRQLTQSPRIKARQVQHARTFSSASGMERNQSFPTAFAISLDKPLPLPPPPELVEIDGGSRGGERTSRRVRYSVSSPDLRNLGLVDLPLVSSPGQGGSRDSALNLLSRSDVVDRLAHPVGEGDARVAGKRFLPPSPIYAEELSRSPTTRMTSEEDGGEEPFTPTRQAAWDQWHTSTIQLRSPESPLPERLPAETVAKLVERQAKSPRQKKPSMEEAVNRARIAKQLFGDLPSSPPPFPLPQPHSPDVEGYEHSHVGSTSPMMAANWQHDRLLHAAFTGNRSPTSPRRYNEANGSPQRTRLAPPTPGSTEASPMPGASFEDIERDLFFSRPRRLWGTPVALPSRNADDPIRLVSGAAAQNNVPHASRQSKDSAGSTSSPSTTRIVSTSDESSHDAHGNVEVATPNFSQNEGHHEKTRFPAISEEDRSDVSDSDDRLLRGDETQTFHDHRWMKKGFLPRDASSNTILNFHEIEARQPEGPHVATNIVDRLGKTSVLPDRNSVVPESGRLGESSDDDDSTGSLALISENGHNGFPAVPTMVPAVGQNDSAYSSVSDINSFVSARSTATIKAPVGYPVLARQDTDLTTMSYATAASKPL